MERIFLAVGALLGLTGVVAGAFGTHVLKARLSPQMLEIFETAVRYQMYHALALLAVGLLAARGPSLALGMAGWFLMGGTVVFSGTLYLLVWSDIRWLGAITPLGGVGLLAGWACLAWAAWNLASNTP